MFPTSAIRGVSPTSRSANASQTVQYVTRSPLLSGVPVMLPEESASTTMGTTMQWNLLREQISTLCSNVGEMRQELTGLKLANSQYETQNDELTRQLRDLQNQVRTDVQNMQSQVRTDMQNEALRLDKVEYSSSTALSESEKLSNSMGDLQERVTKDISYVNDRVSELSRDLSLIRDKPSIGMDDVKNFFQGSIRDVASKMADVCATITGQERLMREVHDGLSKLSNELADHKSNTDGTHKSIRDLIAQERGDREKKHTSALDRLQELERRAKESAIPLEALERKVFNELARMSSDNDAKIDQLKGLQSNTSIACDSVLTKVNAELKKVYEEQRRTSDEHSKKHQSLSDMINKYNSDHHGKLSSSHNGFLDHVRDLEKRLHDKIFGHASEQETKHASHAGAISSLERKLRDEFASSLKDVRSSYPSDRDRNVGDDFARELQTHTSQHRSLLDSHRNDHRKALDEHKTEHRKALQDVESQVRREIAGMLDGLRKEVIDLTCKEQQVREELDRRIKDMVARLASDQESNYSNLSGMLTGLERKLREEIRAIDENNQFSTVEQRMKDIAARLASDQENKYSNLSGMLTGLERKLREEMRSTGENRQISTVEQRMKDMVARLASDHESKYSNLSGMLTGLERKLREEMRSIDENHHGRASDLRDKMERGLDDNGARHGELKTLIREEQKVRDDCHRDLSATLEQLEDKLRQELSASSSRHQTGIRDHIEQEQRLREKAHTTLNARLLQLEEKLLADPVESDSATWRDADMRELVQTMYDKERLQIQESFKGELERFDMLLTQQKDAYSKDKAFMLELESQLRSVMAEVRNHTHEFKSANRRSSPTRNPRVTSPMPTMRNVSPMQSTRNASPPRTVLRTQAQLPQSIVQQAPATQFVSPDRGYVGSSSWVTTSLPGVLSNQIVVDSPTSPTVASSTPTLSPAALLAPKDNSYDRRISMLSSGGEQSNGVLFGEYQVLGNSSSAPSVPVNSPTALSIASPSSRKG